MDRIYTVYVYMHPLFTSFFGCLFYCLHQIKGMNALFGLRVRVTVGERLLVGVGTATGVYLSALQPPPVPRVTSGGAGLGREQERQRAEVQRLLHTTIARNKEAYGTRQPHSVSC